ncbi:MAG: hypothetical protein KDA54_13340 [Phycisphaerales bacterium]|nr:hypothetical protein [Phycisphaerales bacterium]
MKRSLGMVLAVSWVVGTAVPVSAEHPFVLVNVIDLFDMHGLQVPVESTGDCDVQPSNTPLAVSEMRVGTNPSAVATDGTRVWIGGYYGGNGFLAGAPACEDSWYASVGIAELPDITDPQSFPLNFVRYGGTFHQGPGIATTAWFSGLDYDEATDSLYAAFDEALEINPFLLPAGQTHENSFIAKVDINTNSVTYGDFIWKVNDPLGGGQRIEGGVRVDPLDPGTLSSMYVGSGRVWFLDSSNGALLDNPVIYSPEQLPGVPASTAYLQHTYDPTSGDYYARLRNAIERIPRDTSTTVSPFDFHGYQILAGDNGIVETTAEGDDDQLVSFGTGGQSPTTPVIRKGANGVIDTTPLGDDVISATPALNWHGDPLDWPFASPTQGQGIAFIDSSNLVGLDEDLIIATSRGNFGGGMESDIRFIDTNGALFDELLLPCVPESLPDVVPALTQAAFYDVDYHAPSGTLVVLEFERRRLYVYRAQTTTTSKPFLFDHDRDGDLDLVDLWQFQKCFTGSEFLQEEELNFNCQYFTIDEDCDVDIDDWTQFAPELDAGGGPVPTPPDAPSIDSPIEDGDTIVTVSAVDSGADQVRVYVNNSLVATVNDPVVVNNSTDVTVAAMSQFDSVSADQTNGVGTSEKSGALEVGGGNGDVFISLGIRESGDLGMLGSNGTSTGDFEWIGANTNGPGGAPRGFALIPSAGWQTVVFNPAIDPISPFFSLGDGQITETRGILESIALSVDSTSPGRSSGAYTLYVDNVVNVGAGPGSTDVVITDFESFALGDEVLFQEPTFSGSTAGNLAGPLSVSKITADQANGGTQSAVMQWFFKDTTASRWVRVTTFGANNKELPIIDLTRPVRMDVLLQAP